MERQSKIIRTTALGVLMWIRMLDNAKKEQERKILSAEMSWLR